MFWNGNETDFLAHRSLNGPIPLILVHVNVENLGERQVVCLCINEMMVQVRDGGLDDFKDRGRRMLTTWKSFQQDIKRYMIRKSNKLTKQPQFADFI